MTMKCKVELLRFLWLSCVLYFAFCKLCQDDQYIVVMDNGETKCQRCGECQPSYGRYPPCGSRVNYPVVSLCKPCPKDSFSDKDDVGPCKKCHQCAKHEKVSMQCTNASDTKCSGECEDGYYFTKRAPHNCQKCSYCCRDGRDENQTECWMQGLGATNQHCSVRVDKQCSPTATPPSFGTRPSDEGGSNKTVHIVLGVVGAIALIAIMLVVILLWVQRRKKNDRRRADHQRELTQTDVAGASPDGGQLSSGFPQVAPSDGFVNRQYISASNPGTPQLSSVKPINNSQPSAAGINGSTKIQQQMSQDSKTSKGTPKLSSVKPLDSDDRENNQPSTAGINGSGEMKRQVSQDSQSSQGENGYAQRKRSLSSSVIGGLDAVARKMTLKKEDPLLSLDESERSVPVPKIKEHPQSQTIQQGNRAEFTCKVQGKKTVLYQWLKDETELEGQHQCSLVLDSVKMTDFGSYMCRVKYERGEDVESSAAELDVKPPDGKEYKLLKDLDVTTKERVIYLLGAKKRFVGGYSQVAELYDMERSDIDALQQSSEPGKDVIEYLGAYRPTLTVYHFCKELKNKRMKRLDIVEKLENHLVA